jgi:hypothetical protein
VPLIYPLPSFFSVDTKAAGIFPSSETEQHVSFKYFFRGIFQFFFSYYIQHCFICRPSDSTVPTDAGMEPRTVATGALTVRRSNHWARSHPQWRMRTTCYPYLLAVLRIRILMHLFLDLPDPDPLVRGTDPDPSLVKQK